MKKIITNLGKDVEKLEPSHTADGNVNWPNILENCLVVPPKVTYSVSIGLTSSTAQYKTKRIKNIYA